MQLGPDPLPAAAELIRPREPIDAPSPNFGPRRGELKPELVVLHFTAMASAEAALARLRDPASEVSAHWLIAEDGRVWRLVDEAARAWHAGEGFWAGAGDVNSRSIGIELANAAGTTGHPPFPEPQMVALEALLDAVLARWRISPAGVIAHSDLAPARKADPGPKFDWRRLALAGRAVWPADDDTAAGGNCAADPNAFAAAAARFGYVPPDGGRDAVLGAFRLRFRPWAAGRPLEPADVAAAAALAAAHPCVDAGPLPT